MNNGKTHTGTKPGPSSETSVKKGYKKTKLGWIPEEWELEKVGKLVNISVGKDLKEDRFSETKSSKFPFPVYSNTVENFGLYGFYTTPEYNPPSVTVVGRGIGLGTAFYREKPFGAIGRLLVLHPKSKIEPRFLTEIINNKVRFFKESSGIPQLTGVQMKIYDIPLPPLPEQKKIAEILSTWDSAIETLEQLIAKKEELKRGLMQELLTGKIRFPGFDGEWKETKIGRLFEFLRSISVSRNDLGENHSEDSVLNLHYGDLHVKYNSSTMLDVGNSSDIPAIVNGYS